MKTCTHTNSGLPSCGPWAGGYFISSVLWNAYCLQCFCTIVESPLEQRPFGPRGPKYLLSGLLQKTFADPALVTCIYMYLTEHLPTGHALLPGVKSKQVYEEGDVIAAPRGSAEMKTGA